MGGGSVHGKREKPDGSTMESTISLKTRLAMSVTLGADTEIRHQAARDVRGTEKYRQKKLNDTLEEAINFSEGAVTEFNRQLKRRTEKRRRRRKENRRKDRGKEGFFPCLNSSKCEGSKCVYI